MEKNVNRPHKGMMQDINPVDQPKETYRYALNAVNESSDGNKTILHNEKANEDCWSLTTGYYPIGKVYTQNNEVVIFSTNGTNSEIGVVKDCNYTTIINSECLGFDIKFQIDATYRVRRGCETVIYFTDNYNPVRQVNLNKLENYYSDAYITYLSSGDINPFVGEKWNCDLFALIPPYSIPCFSDAQIITGGQLNAGSYNFAIQYLDEGFNPTPWIITSHPVNIYHDDVNAPFNNIDGSSQLEADGLGGVANSTNKAIKLELSNLDDSFTYYRIAVIQATGFTSNVTKTVVSSEIPITQDIFIYNGDLNGYTEISSQEIKPGRIDLEYVAHLEQLENRLILLNTKGKQVNFCSFQKFASKIHSRYVVKEVDATDIDAVGNPKNPLTPFECMGFMGGEVYALGIVYVFKDGFESPVYHIPGPSANQRWNWTTELCEVVADTTPVTPWNSDIEHLVPASDAAAYNALPPEDKIPKWRVYETAINVSATEGQMAYWKCSNSVYEVKESCDGEDYWGQDVCGNDLVNTSIRHHRFPSRTLEPHVDNDASVQSYYKLEVTVSLKDGQVWPIGIPSIDLDIDYDYNGVPQTTFTKTFVEADFASGSITFVVDIQPGNSPAIFTNVVFSGTLVTTYPLVFDITYTTLFAYSNFVDNSVIRLLGVKFSNVDYPHPDIVGHYFVRAERDSFNRTILDSGIAGRARSKSTNAFDYITFSYFTNNNNDAEHHYLFNPKFLYNKEILVPDYLKVESEFDFKNKDLGSERYDAVGTFIIDVDTLIEHRIQNYDGLVLTNGDKNHSKERMLSSDALSYDDNYEPGNRQYNLSHSNRAQMIKLGSSLPKNGDDIPYVTLRVDRDVHCNLDAIKYYKMHNCIFEGDERAEIFGGDVVITPFMLNNTLMRELFNSPLASVLSALLIVGAAVATILTAGAASPLIVGAGAALGATISATAATTAVVITAIVAAAIGVTATAVSALFKAYAETDLDELAEDSELDALNTSATSFLAYANESLVGLYVESEINTSLRQVENHGCGNYYNGTYYINDYFRDRIMYYDQDEEKWLQKGIVCPEIYHFNKDFMRMEKEKVYFPLAKSYDCCSDCLESFPSRVYYSEQSFQEELSDNYRTILPNNYRDIEAEHGEITGVVRKHNNLFVFSKECLWHLPQNVQQGVVNEIVTFIGTGDYFAIPPRKVLDSDMGSAGTLHKWSIVKCPLGVFYVSEIEKSIYLISGAEGGIQKVSSEGMDNWFTEYCKLYLNLQFYDLTGYEFPNLNNPNNPDGIGYHSIYDPRHKRVLFTKRDYLLKSQYVNNFSIVSIVGGVPETPLTTGAVFYDDVAYKFAVATGAATFTYISFDSSYFENKSFTISYSLISQSWVSFHSYIPLFYYSDQNTFYSSLSNKIWKHNINGLYQKFYGTLYSHIIETVSVSNPMITRLWEDIQLQTVARKYNSASDEYFDQLNTTFNYITLYNSRQVSGELQMIVKNLQANPQNYFLNQTVNSNSSIVIDRKERNWHINDFRDMRINYTIPMFTKDWTSVGASYPIDKVVNPTVIDINKDWSEQESFRDKYLIIRLRFANFEDIELSTNFVIETEQQSFR
jgi:hypothetical protein